MSLILQVFYTFFSSVLLSLAIPNEWLSFGSPFIAFAALIPFYTAIKNSKNFWTAFLLGFIQTCATHLISFFWLANFKDFAALTLGASAFGTGCIGAAYGALLYLPYAKKNNSNFLNDLSVQNIDTVPFRVFWFAAVYTSYEWCKSSGFLGYPWGTISQCMFNARIFMQTAAITGTYGITFITVFFSALISEGLDLYYKTPNLPAKKRIISTYKTTASFWLILFSLSMVYGLFQFNKTRTPVKKVTSVIVQQNEDPWKQASDSESITLSMNLTEEKLNRLRGEGLKADLIVWSEGVLKSVFPDSKLHYERYPYERSLTDFIRQNQTPLLTGGSYMRTYSDGSRDYFNAALVFDRYGNFRGYYPKNHLVPFAEAIPFMEYPSVKNFMEKIIGISAGWTPGDQYTFFDIPCQWYSKPLIDTVKNINLNEAYDEQSRRESLPPVTKISTPICYDDAFTDIMRPLWRNGTEVFMNITDDSWSLKKSAEIQHFTVAAYRSIEYRTTLVRSTNSGVSVVLDPAGKVICELPLFEACSSICDIPVYKRTTTTYARFGNWLPFVLNIFLLLYFLWNCLTFNNLDYVFPEKHIRSHKKHHKKSHKKSHKKAKKDKSSKRK